MDVKLSFPLLGEFDQQLDDNVSQEYKDQPLAQDWARIGKVIEELGETVTNLIGYTAQNPRKGEYSSRKEMLDEAADVIITGLLGIQHFTKDELMTMSIVIERWFYRLDKAGFNVGPIS